MSEQGEAVFLPPRSRAPRWAGGVVVASALAAGCNPGAAPPEEAPIAMEADAWATALLVLGLDAGLQLAERENLAALFVERGPSGIKVRTTANFPR